MTPCRMVPYIRVSTQKQGVSGLGEEAQRETVQAYAQAQGCELLKEWVEVESGRKDDRPALAAAIEFARRRGATLLIARLDRLTRSVSFLGKLRDAKVRFVCCDFPEANKLTINIMASVAEYEAERIAANTKAAMAAAKARPADKRPKFGNPLGIKAIGGTDDEGKLLMQPETLAVRLAHCRAIGRAAHTAKTNAHAEALASTIEEIRAEGVTTLRGIAAALNERGELTTNREPVPGVDRRWHTSNVARLLMRLKRLPETAA